MQLKTTKEDLFNRIQIVHNIVGTRVSLPILSNILLDASAGKLKLTTTDLDIGISCEYPVEVVESGTITVPAKRFADIVHELPEGPVSLTAKKNNMVTIQTENCEFKIVGLPKDEFPKLPEFKDKETIKIEQGILRDMLIKTAFAVSHDETRYVLNGILFKIENNKLSLIATDGRRLALIEKNINIHTSRDINIIIPLKTITELNRNLKDNDEAIMITLGDKQALFDLGTVQIISRLIEGEFPNYRQVIPQEQKEKIKLNREKFLLAVKRTIVLSTQDYQVAKLEIFKNKLVISKSTPDVGESREELASEYSGKEMIIGFNPAYLIDALKNIQDEFINLEVWDPEKPGVIRSDGYIYLVLPMRV